ncbi:hypothetical protein HPB47_017388 [Ixodes persulcatus]|uniref:Uncharacterized protein n=1 Tax=Ixodes persulcatus TaxID=34615 RepID=A0AC60R1M5_IXOPE|nr:hypothetical protein HPB47_017388 [Ixodes persulcatus]
MARLILDQVLNFNKKRPTWSETTVRHCVILRNLSTKTYEYIRQEELLKLPCRNTLQKYVGNPAGEVGFSSLVCSRLRTEVESLKTPQSRVCSLVVDEMHIRQRLDYNKQQDAFIGDVNLSVELGHLVPSYENSLANALLCFLLCGLSVGFKIPIGYFFTKGCTGDQLAAVILHIIQKVEGLGLEVVRLVSDNHKSNVASSSSYRTGTLISVDHNAAKATSSFPVAAEERLRELCISPRPQQPGPGAASIAMCDRQTQEIAMALVRGAAKPAKPIHYEEAGCTSPPRARNAERENKWKGVTSMGDARASGKVLSLAPSVSGKNQLKTLMRQLVLKRAWDLQLAVFPGPNPTTALYVPQDAKVPGPASALLNLIGHVFGMCNGHDHLVAGPAKPAQDIPE